MLPLLTLQSLLTLLATDYTLPLDPIVRNSQISYSCLVIRGPSRLIRPVPCCRPWDRLACSPTTSHRTSDKSTTRLGRRRGFRRSRHPHYTTGHGQRSWASVTGCRSTSTQLLQVSEVNGTRSPFEIGPGFTHLREADRRRQVRRGDRLLTTPDHRGLTMPAGLVCRGVKCQSLILRQ